MQYLVPDLAQHWVVQLEEAELHAVVRLHDLLCPTAVFHHILAVGRFQFLQYGIRPRHDALRHAGQLGHVDTEGVLASAPFQLTQEDDFLVHFAHRHVIVLHAGIQLLHLVQLMVMRGEERPCPPFFIFMDVFHDSPRDADTIVRRRATP